ncbi:A24 family peptidase [Arthrobacter sp. B3I4]|uniref:prepilin peptidase n=1 Tax=Arthrobacter sp. B3I4 TaxID=3042267 RepID=UPI0027809B9F|nr:A24 family peptidase [Arthrobacter sp. B3I4]MDQ0755524.1 leader peptidase (prepilin peptidase)/N-methyltransferase [Arthrobacter sp. B3I4]
MPDPALAGSASLLFLAGTAALGLCLALLGDVLIRRSLPRLTPHPSPAQRMTTSAAAALLCALLGWRFGLSPALPAFLVLAVGGVHLARIDIFHHLLPNRLVVPLLGAGIISFAAASVALGAWGQFGRGLAGGTILFSFYFILALISPNSIGMGDVKLAAPVGLYLGYLGWSQLFYGGALGFVAGGVASLAFLLRKRTNKPPEVAYGPSMLAAAFAVILVTA